MLFEIKPNTKPSELKKYLGCKVVSFNKYVGNTGLNNSDEVYLGAFSVAGCDMLVTITLVYRGTGGHWGAWDADKVRWNKIKSLDKDYYRSWSFDTTSSKIIVKTNEAQLEFEF